MKSKIKCNECYKLFSCKSIGNHLWTVHGEGSGPKCDLCTKRFESETRLKTHNSSVHGQVGETFFCDNCGKKFRSQHNLNQHKRMMHKKTGMYFCTLCRKAFYNKELLNCHVRKTHPPTKQKCDFCDITYTCNFALKKHISSIHEGKKYLFKCNIMWLMVLLTFCINQYIN